MVLRLADENQRKEISFYDDYEEKETLQTFATL